MGRPAQVYDDKGELVWQVEFDIYGRIRLNLFNNKSFIPFRQLGQYEDVETGLYYNRCRYYDPESGIFISSDPISILGGLNTYAYVSDSNALTDVFVTYMKIFNDNEGIYIGDNKISATWIFIGKDEKSEAITLFENLFKGFELNFGIYEETNSTINPKIDFSQKAFGKKKLDLFIKNRTQNYFIEIDGKKYYIDFSKLDTLELWEYFFKFIFDDFFYSHLLLKINKKDHVENLLGIKDQIYSSSNVLFKSYFKFNNNTVFNLIFGYSHDGKKVFVFLSDKKINGKSYFNPNITKNEFHKIYTNVVLFRPFDAHIKIYTDNR